MVNDIQVLKQTELLGQQFVVYGTPEEPLFLAKDVATWIEHTDVSKMVQSVDDDEKLTRTLFVSGQNREVWMLTENGLYELLMMSRKPIAKEFKKRREKDSPRHTDDRTIHRQTAHSGAATSRQRSDARGNGTTTDGTRAQTKRNRE